MKPTKLEIARELFARPRPTPLRPPPPPGDATIREYRRVRIANGSGARCTNVLDVCGDPQATRPCTSGGGL